MVMELSKPICSDVLQSKTLGEGEGSLSCDPHETLASARQVFGAATRVPLSYSGQDALGRVR